MRILVIGNSHSTKVFSNLLCKNKSNLVFSTFEKTDANFVDINFLDVLELKEFAIANEIELTILTDFESIEADFIEVFHSAGLSIFAPDFEASKICSFKSSAKKFMYRNKIKTPRFQIFDKSQLALEHIRNTKYPIVIKPDEHIHPQGTVICETYKYAKETLNNFLEIGTKIFVIEDYVQGREFSAYVITDGFNSFLLDLVSTKQNRYAKLGASFVDSKKVMQEIINPTIEALVHSCGGYIGILGIDCVQSSNGEIYTLEYNPFFESLDVELFVNCIGMPWEKLFESAVSGTLKDEFQQIKKSSRNCVAMITDSSEVVCAQGRTLNEAIENLEVEDWKF